MVGYGAHSASNYLQCKDLLPVIVIFTRCVSSHLFVRVCVHVCGWCTGHDTCVEIRQSVGVCAIFHHVGPRDQIRVWGSAGRVFTDEASRQL